MNKEFRDRLPTDVRAFAKLMLDLVDWQVEALTFEGGDSSGAPWRAGVSASK